MPGCIVDRGSSRTDVRYRPPPAEGRRSAGRRHHDRHARARRPGGSIIPERNGAANRKLMPTRRRDARAARRTESIAGWRGRSRWAARSRPSNDPSGRGMRLPPSAALSDQSAVCDLAERIATLRGLHFPPTRDHSRPAGRWAAWAASGQSPERPIPRPSIDPQECETEYDFAFRVRCALDLGRTLGSSKCHWKLGMQAITFMSDKQ